MPRYTVKLFGFIPLDLMWVFQLVMDALFSIVDGFVKGEELNRTQKKITRTLHYLGEEWGRDLVKSTETPMDDVALDGTISKCKDTAEEGKFELVTIPELPEN